MRLVILVAAFGMLGATLALSPTFSPAAQAQSATPQQQGVQAQLVALAQAGDWEGFSAFATAQVGAGNAAMLAGIADAMADMGLALADSDDASATAMTLAALALVEDPSVNNANASLAAKVGNVAAQVRTKIQRRNPAGAAAIQASAARSSASGLFIAFNAAPQTISTSSTTPVVVVQRRTPSRPDTSEVPVVTEPNPSQSGSPT